MRVTNNMMINSMLQELQKGSRNLLDAQEVMGSQKKINRISDDPLSGLRLLGVKQNKVKIDQLMRNINNVNSLQSFYDTTLNEAIDTLTQAKELVLSQASSAAATDTTREAVAIELISLRQDMLNLANSRLSNRYIYSGSRDTTQAFSDITATSAAGGGNGGTGAISSTVTNPVEIQIGDTYQIQFTDPVTYDIVNVTQGYTISSGNAYTPGNEILFEGIQAVITGAPAAGDVFDVNVNIPGVYQGDSQATRVEIDDDQLAIVNLNGNVVFQGAGLTNGEDIFDLYNDVIEALRANDLPTIDASLDRFDRAINQVVNQRAVIGSRQNSLEDINQRLDNVQIGLEALQADLENVDITEAITDFNQAQLGYEAALSATAQITNVSLLDFLR